MRPNEAANKSPISVNSLQVEALYLISEHTAERKSRFRNYLYYNELAIFSRGSLQWGLAAIRRKAFKAPFLCQNT
jgi:hypothetical protein